MKGLLGVIILVSSLPVFAGKSNFVFPNVEFSYARLYLFNVTPPDESTFYDFDIYRDGRYANSKIGNGWEVSDELLSKLNAAFSPGVNGLVVGLSSCYIPRHGIIFFDDKGKPVASFSACFECQRIGFWSSVPLPEFKTEPSAKDMKIAENQITELSKALESSGIPVYKTEPEYGAFSQNEEMFSDNGEMVFTFDKDNDFSSSKFSLEQVKKWAVSNYHFSMRESTATEPVSGDQLPHVYKTLTDKGGTIFRFTNDMEDAVLFEAEIKNSAIVMPNGVSVGMSLDEVQASFMDWDGIAYPASIVAVYPGLTIRYKIEKRTLAEIELVFAS